MKILVEFYEGLFLQNRKEKLNIPPSVQTTDQLFKIISAKIQKKEKEINLRFKKDGYTLKIIRGWDIDFYEIKDGTKITAEILETSEEKDRKQQQKINQNYMHKLFNKKNIPIQLSDINEEEPFSSSSHSNAKGKDSTQTPEYRSFNSDEFETYSDQQRREKNKKLLNYGNLCELQLQHFLQLTKIGGIEQVKDLIQNVIPQEFSQEEKEVYLENNKKMINQNGIQGWNALHFAVFCSHIDILQYFISEKEADVNKITGDGWTPLQLAITKGNQQVLQLLLENKNLNINEVTQRGTALHLASKLANQSKIELLLENGADCLIKDEQGFSVQQVCNNVDCQNLFHLFEQANFDFLQYKALQVKENFQKEQNEIQEKELQQMNEFQKICRELSIFCPPKPPKVMGFMYKIGTLLYGQSQRFMMLDLEQNSLIRFKNKNRFPVRPSQIIPLNEIIHLQFIQPSQFMDKKLYYFEITHKENQLYACKNLHTLKLWLHFLYQAIRFNKVQRKVEKKGYNLNMIDQGRQDVIELRDDEQQDKVIWEYEQQKISQKQQENKETQSKLKQSIRQISQSHIRMKRKTENQQQIEDNLPIASKPKLPSIAPPSSSHENHQEQTENKGNLEQNKGKNGENLNDNVIDEEQINKLSEEKVNFDSFDIIRVLGQGAFGKVFLVKKKNSQELFAMKALKKRNLILRKQLRFAVTEANVLKNCNHTFVMGLHFAFQTPSYLYLVMDYCPGGDIGQHLMQRTTFDEETSRFYIAELVLAIESLHSKNIIYRDLKPENILVAQDGHIKLADFGLSKEGIGRNEQTTTFCGTPAYLSPEMVIQKRATTMSDIYGIGTCLYEMLTGEPPFYQEDIPTMYKLIKDSSLKYPGHIQKNTKEFLKKLLEKNPSKRLGYNGFQEIKNDVYFKDIDFKALEQKRYDPPILNFEDDVDETDLQIFNTKKPVFKDQDYNEQNKRVNRVVRFTFVRN